MADSLLHFLTLHSEDHAIVVVDFQTYLVASPSFLLL